MTYRVLPNFLRQREQRLWGLVTPFQLIAGLGSLLPIMLAIQVSLWLAPPVLCLVALAIYGLTPMEGEVRGLLWIYRLRARMEREVEGLEPFAPVNDGRAEVVPLVLLDEEHGVALATEVEA